jgi:ATP-dependent protease ClpP protease subunit
MDLKCLRARPHIRLTGSIDNALVDRFLNEWRALAQGGDGPSTSLLLELSTQGGDADLGELLAEEIRLLRESYQVDCLFLGTSFVYSAGITVMSAFPVENRYLTRNTMLLIHERRLDKQVHLCGSLQSTSLQVQELQDEIRNGQAVQERGFARLAAGSDISLAEILERTRGNWYLTAEEALARRLVAGLF